MDYTKPLAEITKDVLADAGGKGASLGELSRAGLPVPPGFVLTTAAYDAFVESNGIRDTIVELASIGPATDPAAYEEISEKIHKLFSGGKVPHEVAEDLRVAYQELDEEEGAAVAVRSSATAEDLAGASFAGQQETFLNVIGAERLTEAVKDCWASLWTARAMAYRGRQDIDPATVSLAVVVQRMVASEVAGVMFTVNPSNGRRDQATISAAWGLGEAVVSGSVTTDDFVIAKADARVLWRQTADKEVMTVCTGGGTEQRPVPEALRRQPVLSDEQAAQIARLGATIEQHFGSPQDIEWALAGGEFFIVQSRPITALPEPMSDPPTDWTVPYPRGLYFRASIVEQLPDPLSPLFADLIDGSVTRSLTTLLAQALGTEIMREGDLGLPTINGYAYYFYRNSAFLRLLVKWPTVVRAMARGAAHMGIRGWQEHSHPHYSQLVETRREMTIDELPAHELLEGVSHLLDAGTQYYTAVQSIIPIAACTEVLFTAFYDRFVRRHGDPPAQTFLLGFDSLPIRAEKSLYDLATWTLDHAGLAEALKNVPLDRVLDLLGTEEPPAGVDEGVWRAWRFRFRAHLDRFGHTVYNLDFMNPVPADDPAPLFDTLRFYLRGQGQNPYERQKRTAERREEATRAVFSRLDTPRRSLFARLLEWSQAAAPVREDALADVGLAWPLIRRMLLELGRRLTDAGAIKEPADVFWLRRDELGKLASSLDAGETRLDGLWDAVEGRRMLWRGQRPAMPPQMLPKGAWFGLMEGIMGRLMPAGSEDQTGDTIRGVGASQGQVTAPARVLSGPGDFSQMRPGEVLVAGITTPAWTSLFAMASAVVTDVGGPLSHSSIVAREYGIPAVLGTGVATRRIQNGQRVSVDGDTGTVTLLDGTDGESGMHPARVASEPGAFSNGGRKAVALGLATGAAIGAAALWKKWRR